MKLAEGAVTKVLGLDLPWSFLVQCEDVFTACELLFPSFHLFLPRECVGLQDPIHNSREFTSALINILGIAFIASDTCVVVVSISFGFRSYSNLRDLLWRLIPDYNLSRSPYIQHKRVALGSLVEVGMLVFACAAAVEAI